MSEGKLGAGSIVKIVIHVLLFLLAAVLFLVGLPVGLQFNPNLGTALWVASGLIAVLNYCGSSGRVGGAAKARHAIGRSRSFTGQSAAAAHLSGGDFLGRAVSILRRNGQRDCRGGLGARLITLDRCIRRYSRAGRLMPRIA